MVFAVIKNIGCTVHLIFLQMLKIFQNNYGSVKCTVITPFWDIGTPRYESGNPSCCWPLYLFLMKPIWFVCSIYNLSKILIKSVHLFFVIVCYWALYQKSDGKSSKYSPHNIHFLKYYNNNFQKWSYLKNLNICWMSSNYFLNFYKYF